MNTEQTEKNVEKTEKKRFSLNTPDKALLAVVALLILIIVVLGILQRLGLSLVNGTMMLQLPVLTVVVLISWGATRWCAGSKTAPPRSWWAAWPCWCWYWR